MLRFFDLFRRQPPRPTALELAAANHTRLMNAREAAARERQRLIVEWLRSLDRFAASSPHYLADQIEAGEPLKTARPEGRPPGPRSPH